MNAYLHEEERKAEGGGADAEQDIGDDNYYRNDDKAEDEVPMEVVKLIKWVS